MNTRAVVSLPTMLILAFALPAIAATSADELLLEEMTTRLKLTEAQQTQIAPPLEQRNKRLKALRSDLSENASQRQKLKALRQARSIQQDFVGKVSPVLTKEQKAEWEEMR